jgi:NNP family nitrate/nitrite transporter-like MFS transporter
LQLALGTGSFAICFCAWGLISAFAPSFRREFGLSATQTSLLVATPVLLGSLARIPVGLLTDRFGGQAHPHAAVPGVGDRNFAAINSG